MKHKFEAVTYFELTQRLGLDCSPMAGKDGYVIGPDINGRLCHIATCFTMAEAKRRAEEANRRAEQNNH